MGAGTCGSTDEVSSRLVLKFSRHPNEGNSSRFGIRPKSSAFTEELGITTTGEGAGRPRATGTDGKSAYVFEPSGQLRQLPGLRSGQSYSAR